MEELFVKKIIELLSKQGYNALLPDVSDPDNDTENFLLSSDSCIGIHILNYSNDTKVLDYELGIVSTGLPSKEKKLEAYFHRTAVNIHTPVDGVEVVIAAAKTMHSRLLDRLNNNAGLLNAVVSALTNALVFEENFLDENLATPRSRNMTVKDISREEIEKQIKGESPIDQWFVVEFEGKSAEYEYYCTVEAGILTINNTASITCNISVTNLDYDIECDEEKEETEPLTNDLLDIGEWKVWISDTINNAAIKAIECTNTDSEHDVF